jgi:hypothetical protein
VNDDVDAAQPHAQRDAPPIEVDQPSSSVGRPTTCAAHGALPPTAFTRDDLRMGRHRCKQCVAAAVRQSRRRHPLQVMWSRGVQRLKQRRPDLLPDWSWVTTGRRILMGALAATPAAAEEAAVLAASCDTATTATESRAQWADASSSVQPPWCSPSPSAWRGRSRTRL